MAEFGQYNNYPTYPGLGPWVNTHFEGNFTEDYRIDERNVPSSRAAVRQDIFSSEYSFSDWLGPIIPLPSAFLSGALTVVLTPIIIRGSYSSWLNTGQAFSFSSLTSSENFGIRPPTFHYQVRDQYKETVHYGFEMILLGHGLPTGGVEVISVDSFIPYLEHRTQSTFEKFFVRDGLVGSVEEVNIDIGVEVSGTPHLISMSGFDELPSEAINMTQPITASIYMYDSDSKKTTNVSLSIYRINPDGTMLAFGTVPENFVQLAPGNYMFLDKAIQIEDPTMLYSEIRSGDSYWSETEDGFRTREQHPKQGADMWTSIVYDLQPVQQTVDQLIENYKNESERATAEGDTVAVLKADANVIAAEKVKAYLESKYVGDTRQIFADGTTETRADETAIDVGVIIEIFKGTDRTTIDIRLPIDGAQFSMNNFHAGTQEGSYMRIVDSEGNLHVYPILRNTRNGVYTLPVDSISSSKSIFDILLDEKKNVFEIYSPRMWRINDITTANRGSAGNTSSFDRGIFVGSIDSTEIEEETTTGRQGTTTVRRTTVFYKVDNDRDYYDIDYLVDRFYDDPDPSQGTVKAWKKFSNWRLYRRGSERTESYPIIDSTDFFRDGERLLLLTLDDEYENLADESNWEGEFWIGFNSLIDTQPSSLDYVSIPFLGLNAFLGLGESTSSGRNTITFEGIYVGSPVGIDLPAENATISLIEDNPGIFSNVGTSGNPIIRVSSAKAFKYISFNEDIPNDSEIIFYNRDDDASSALYARRGRVDYKYDISEFLVYLGDSTEVDSEISQSQAVTSFSIPGDAGDVDIVGIRVVKDNLKERPAENKGVYNHTIWSVYHGDRNLGYRSQSGKENSFLTRANGEYEVSGATHIDLFHNAEYFSTAKSGIEYSIPGNTLTGDPLTTGNRIRFLTAKTGDARHSKFSSAKLLTVPNNMVLRDVGSHGVLTHGDGQLIVLANQPQWRYLEGASGSSDYAIDSVTIVEGTESGNKTVDTPPSNDDIDMEQDGVFMMCTTDRIRSFSSGLFLRPFGKDDPTGRGTLYSTPYLLSENMTLCDYSKEGINVDVAGFSKIKDGSGNEVLALVYRRHNIDAMFGKPVFKHDSNGQTAFLTCQTALFDTVVMGNTSTDEIKPSFVVEDLDQEPISMTADSRYSIIVYRNSNNLSFAISTSGGKRWSLFDDVFLVNDTGRIAGPSVKMYGDSLMLFYYVDRVTLKYKRISLPNIVKMHVKYMKNGQSSKETNEEVNKVKQELQTLLDNTKSIKVADSFEQKVSFGINSRDVIHVVYYNDDGRVESAESTTQGETWNISPVNF